MIDNWQESWDRMEEAERKDIGEYRQLEGESLVEAAREHENWPEDKFVRTPSNAAAQYELDEQLMREAMEALEPLAQCTEDSPPTSPEHRTLYDGAFVGIVLGDARRARATITKLEERLLNE